MLQVGKLNEIATCGESVDLLEKCGILLDSEAEFLSEQTDQSDSHMARLVSAVYSMLMN